jgi:integrase
MSKLNPANERVKRQYFSFLRDATRQDETTVDAVAKALDRFERDTGRRDFRTFRREQAIAFKRRLAETTAARSGKPLSKATLHATLSHLKRFFQWLAGQPGFKSRIHYSDAEYFNLSDKESRVATARREKAPPALAEVHAVIARMPYATEIERRDRAVVAFILLTGARDSAVASMRLKHVDLGTDSVYQDAREVRTKNSKTFRTFFFPVAGEARSIVGDWITYLRQERGWQDEDPLFPATAVTLRQGDQKFCATALRRDCWSTATPIRQIFKRAFESAGLRYCNPHSLRKTLVHLGQTCCRTPEQFKVWSQNLGHEGVLTTFMSYGFVAEPRQAEVMKSLGREAGQEPTAADFSNLLEQLQGYVERFPTRA